jgi:Ni,Fe-hydrogenase III large subunit
MQHGGMGGMSSMDTHHGGHDARSDRGGSGHIGHDSVTTEQGGAGGNESTMDHGAHRTATVKDQEPSGGMHHGATPPSAMEHGGMEHHTPEHGGMSHEDMSHGGAHHGDTSGMDHNTMAGVDHAATAHDQHHEDTQETAASHEGHSAHEEAGEDTAASDGAIHDDMEGMDHAAEQYGAMGPGGMTHPGRSHENMAGTDHAAMDQMAPGHTEAVTMNHGTVHHADMGGMDHGAMGHGGMAHSEADHGGMDHSQMGAMDHSQMDHGGMNHGGMSHEGMSHGDMGGLMSMEMMTKDLPRSPDGLAMEWVEAPFGPLFPGLPGGLALTLTLDGDRVARATVTPGTVARGLAATWPGPAASFVARFVPLDPLTPVAYRVLAQRALLDAAGMAPDEAAARQAIGVLERERLVSHLNWLASIGTLLGALWLAERAAALQRALLPAQDGATVGRLQQDVRTFVRRVQQTPLLEQRLDGVGVVGVTAEVPLHGPLARATGAAADARTADPAYLALGFTPVVRHGADALARLQVRLAEICQSLDLVVAAGTLTLPSFCVPTGREGSGMATLETPRGAATLRLTLAGDMVRDVLLDTPSAHHVGLVPTASVGQELADALVSVASLDISVWERDQ